MTLQSVIVAGAASWLFGYVAVRLIHLYMAFRSRQDRMTAQRQLHAVGSSEWQEDILARLQRLRDQAKEAESAAHRCPRCKQPGEVTVYHNQRVLLCHSCNTLHTKW